MLAFSDRPERSPPSVTDQIAGGAISPLTLARSRSFLAGPVALGILLFAFANVAIAFWSDALRKEREQNLLLRHGASADRASARYDWSVGERLDEFWPAIPDARTTALVVLSGMSQMYAINDAEEGDRTISEHLDDALAPRGLRVFGLAAPNLNNEEALLYLVALGSRPETTPRLFLYGACFDKMRNTDLRPGIEAFLRGRPDIAEEWRRVAVRHSTEFPAAAAKMIESLADLQKSVKSGDITLESRIRDVAATVLPVVRERSDLNAFVQSGILYRLRNAVFRIRATSKRPVIAGRYSLNREFFELMSRVAEERGIRFAAYVIPLNPQAENPYVPSEYAAFKEWLSGLATTRGIPFANLEDAVPADDWGLLDGGPDFKHFREAGHRITAARILEAFGPEFDAARGARP